MAGMKEREGNGCCSRVTRISGGSFPNDFGRNHSNYGVLVNALNLRYGEEHMMQIYRSQLRNQTQRPEEEETALETFVKTVRDSDLRQRSDTRGQTQPQKRRCQQSYIRVSKASVKD
ncbi:hypothetical protein HELRODRAFT_166976 [Helobdella robusta]|uniref:Uncharacterized protein n=1 Tax=Helobdella robusta TaxID=6412 RepID=T1EYU2_HELRO|nr:hypothetical protein HELRODRAFT_166976 [Helobdella robusta]ESO11887.1 hypothetical protein HELRODRAFT_166976 [Helobdella robusta]